MKQSPKLPAEVRRTQLVRAAEKLFRKKGYAGASVDDIARAVQLTKGAVYFHFGSKEELFFEVIRQYWTNNIAPLYDIVEKSGDSEDYFKDIIHFGFELIKKGQYFSIPFWEQALKIPRIRKYWMDEYGKIIDALATGAARRTRLAIGSGIATMRILGAVLDGMIVQHHMFRECLDLESQEKELVNIMKAYLKG
jgi:AcrR family transcriptional regulator